MIQGVDGEFNFLPGGGFEDNQVTLLLVMLPPIHPPTSSFPKASKVTGDASTPFDADSDPDIHEFPSSRELKHATDCYWVIAHANYEKTLSLLHAKVEGLESKKERLKAFEIQICTTFEEISKLKEPFVLEKMPSHRMSSKDKYDRAGEDMANASFPFLSEFTLNPYAFVEQLLSIKPRSL
nr:hypothetical protein [Tanacetum cinerariifolium]